MLAPYAAAASGELERTLPLIDALLSLARPAAVPVDLRTTLRPLATLYEAIARATGGSLRITNDTEQMFVDGDPVTVRVLLAELLDAAVADARTVTGVVARDGDRIALRLSPGLARPLSDDVHRLSAGVGARLSLDDQQALIMFPSLAHAGVDSKT